MRTWLGLIFALVGFLVLTTVNAVESSDFQLVPLGVITATNASQLQQISRIAPDGSDLAGRSDNVEVLHLAEQPAGSAHWQTSISFSPDGTYFATGSYDTSIRVWDLASGRRVHTLLGHLEMVNDIAFSPDSTMIASASGAFDWYQDFSVRLWDVQSGLELNELQGHTDQVQSVTFHPTQNLLVTTGFDGTVLLWNIDAIRSADKSVEEASTTLFEGNDWLADASFSPDGTYLGIVGKSDALMFETNRFASPEELYHESGREPWLHDVEFSPDSQQLLAGGHQLVSIWDVNTGQLDEVWAVQNPLYENTDFATHQIAFSRTNGLLAVTVNEQIQIWEYPGKNRVAILTGHDSTISDLAFSPDGKLLISVAFDGTIRLWGVPLPN